MRVYVTATCFDPLRAYVYPDGLARFATEPYTQVGRGEGLLSSTTLTHMFRVV